MRLSEQLWSGYAPQVAQRPYRNRSVLQPPDPSVPACDTGFAKNKNIDGRFVRELANVGMRAITLLQFGSTLFKRLLAYGNLAHPTGA